LRLLVLVYILFAMKRWIKGTIRTTTTLPDGKVVKLTKFPPGAALGAHSLHSWSVNRSGGMSGDRSWLDSIHPTTRNKRPKWRSKKSKF
jgi:hypothetical protein